MSCRRSEARGLRLPCPCQLGSAAASVVCARLLCWQALHFLADVRNVLGVTQRTKGDNLFTLPESAKSMIGREDAEALLKSMQESEKTDE